MMHMVVNTEKEELVSIFFTIRLRQSFVEEERSQIEGKTRDGRHGCVQENDDRSDLTFRTSRCCETHTYHVCPRLRVGDRVGTGRCLHHDYRANNACNGAGDRQ